MSRAIVLNRSDNVATLIDSGRAGETCTLQGDASGHVTLLQDVPFGHKVCVLDTPQGANVLKYGQVIGKASRALKMGEHTHVHNIESARGRGDLNKG
ncbi:UxaA family hydrolase [Paraburkholderia sp. 40]|uniref:UxaA family hydrolase n=1 Tax=unclassified Paraburkholderia TaxID=2615204 RepID=UPI003D23D393